MSRVFSRRDNRAQTGVPLKKGVALFSASAIVASLMTGFIGSSAGAATVSGSTGVTTAVAAPAVKSEVTVQDGKDVIVVLYHWNWKSIAKECTDVLGPKGYGYVQTSPPQESIKGSMWWTVYQPVSYKLDSKFGSEAEFKSMVETCNKAGVGVVADMVVNHMSGSDGGVGTGGTSFSKTNYPGLYGSDDFNKDCPITNYGDRYQVQNCWLVGLQDLKTESDHVRSTIAGYFDKLADYGVAGYRVDAVKHIPASDMQGIRDKMTSAKSKFWFYEIINAPGEPIQADEYLGSGDSQEFRYAWSLKSAFDGDINSLQGLGNGFIPSNKANVFVDNHDTERGGDTINYKWGAKYKLANVFMLAYPYGSPTVHSGYEFTSHDAGPAGATETTVPDATCGGSSQWTCTHQYDEIANMVGFNNAVRGTEVTNWQNGGSNVISFGRGSKGQVVINNSNSVINQSFNTSVPDGTYCDVVSGSYDNGVCGGTTVTVSGGKFTKEVPPYGAVAFYVGGTTPKPQPTVDPTVEPTEEPTVEPTVEPTEEPTEEPTVAPTDDADEEAPTSPTALKAVRKSATEATLTWKPASDNVGVAGYYVTVSSDSGIDSVDLEGDQLNFIATDLAPGVNYRFDVSAYDAAGNESEPIGLNYINEADDENDTEAPSAPGQVVATADSPTSVQVRWSEATDNVGVAAYVITRTTATGIVSDEVSRDRYQEAVNANRLSQIVGGIESGNAYRIHVRARDAAGNVSAPYSIGYRAPKSTSNDKVAPSETKNLTAIQVDADQVKLTWEKATDNVGVAAYEVEIYGQTGEARYKVKATQLNYVFEGLEAGESYILSVRALDAAGNTSEFVKIPVSLAIASYAS